MKLFISIMIIALLSGCSTIQRYVGVAKDAAEDLSTSTTNAAVYDICALIRARDLERIFYTVELKKARALICSNKIEVIDGGN